MKVDPGNGVNFLIMRTFHVLIVVFLLGACARRQPVPETVRPVKVTMAAGAAVIDKDFAGLATPDDAVNLAFKLPGQVLDVPVAQGESVKKGALLAELDPRDIELQVSADRSAFEEARSQMQRMQRLLEHEAVSRQEFESAQTRYAQVKSAYENSLGLLKETKLSGRTIAILLIMRFGQMMSLGFDKAYIMQNSLNYSVSEVLSTYIYKQGIKSTKYSYSAAISLFNNLINLIMLVTVNRISDKLSGNSLF